MIGRIGAGLLKQSKTAQEDNKRSTRRNTLSLLIRVNTMQDLPTVQRMDDEQVMARGYKSILNWRIHSLSPAEIPTFIVAGHETTRYAHVSPQTSL